MELFEDFHEKAKPTFHIDWPPFGGDAETVAYEFGWLPLEWQKRAIFVASKDWPAADLRKLAAWLVHCADKKDAKKCRS